MNIIGIYPGRFQPPHKGHLEAYNQLKRISGQNTYVASADPDKVQNSDKQKNPLSFKDKQQIWTKHGVPTDKIVEVKSPYIADEITKKFDSNNTAAVFLVGEKDRSRFPFKPKKDGSPSYYQPFKGNEQNLQSYKKHGYIIFAPAPTLKIKGKDISATDIRSFLGAKKYTDKQKKIFFQYVFGWYDIALYEYLTEKFEEPKANSMNEEKLKKLIKYIMNEAEFATSVGATDTTNADARKSSAEQKDDLRKQKELARKQLKEKELEKKNALEQKKYMESSLDQLKRIKIPQIDDEITNLKKRI